MCCELSALWLLKFPDASHNATCQLFQTSMGHYDSHIQNLQRLVLITIFYIIFLHLCINMKYVYATPWNIHWEWLNRDWITVWSSHISLLILYLVSGTVQFRDHSHDEHNKYIAWFYKRSSGLTIRYITKDCIPNGKYCVASFIPLCPWIGEWGGSQFYC